MKFPSGADWPDWQRDYRYGALVIQPPHELAAGLDAIRDRLDPVSAGRFGAHITVTPPFVGAATRTDEARIGSVVRRVSPMSLRLGRPRQFGGSPVVYLPVVNAAPVVRLRQLLLATGLFRLDLPHTTDFVPHLTISEFGTTPAAALSTVVPAPGARGFRVRSIAWVVPDEGFHFTVRQTFLLA